MRFLPLLCVFALPAFGAIGFRTIRLADPSRTGGPMAEVAVHMWYPAAAGTGRALRQGDYLSLRFHPQSIAPLTAEERASAGNGAAQMLEFSGGAPLDPTAYEQYLESPVQARLDAAPAPGRWPVLIGGMEGASTSSDLAERLAARGYVVATFLSPAELGAMQVQRPQQAIEHVARTLESLLGLLRERPEVDASRAGVLAINFNGLGALVLQMRSASVKAVVSLDGVEAKQNGVQYLAGNIWFAPPRFATPYLLFVQDEPGRESDLQRAAFDRLRYSDRTWIQIRDMRHPNHFPNINRLPGQRREAVSGYEEMIARVAAFCDRHVKGDASATVAGSIPSFSQYAHADALMPVPNEVELDRLLMSSLATALETYAEARRRDPDLNVLPESAFDLYAFRYRQQNKIEDVLTIRRAVSGMFPLSTRAALSLAAELGRAGRREAAVEAIREARRRLAVEPGDREALGRAIDAEEKLLAQ